MIPRRSSQAITAETERSLRLDTRGVSSSQLPGPRVAELAVFGLVLALATWLLERRLLAELAGYVRARRGSLAPG
jgi:hypothetical protein